MLYIENGRHVKITWMVEYYLDLFILENIYLYFILITTWLLDAFAHRIKHTTYFMLPCVNKDNQYNLKKND